MLFRAVVLALCVAGAAQATTTVTTATVAAADVCSNDEWSYLCNKDSWAGAADAVTGGKELLTAGLRRAMDHIKLQTVCDATDTECIQAKAIVDAQVLDIPKVINSNQLGQVHDGAGLIHPAAKTLSWTTGYALNTGNLANGAQASHVTTQSGCTHAAGGTSTSWVGFTTDGSGTGAQFTVTFNNAGPDLITQVTVARAGTGYKAGDTIAFSAAALNTPTYGTQAMTLCTGTVTIKLTTADLNKSANSGKPTTTTALYTGDTLSIDTFYGVQTGSDFIDDESLIKWVDASSQNGCDDNDGAANDAAQRLAGHPDVRGSAHVMVPTGTSTCSSPMGTTTFNNFDQAADITTANRASYELYIKCQSFDGQGRKACQAAGCQYTPAPRVAVAFGYTNLVTSGAAKGVGATAANPKTTKWRLCMTSPSIADNTVFADTLLTVTAACPTGHEWKIDVTGAGATATGTQNCVCEAGRTTDRNAALFSGAPSSDTTHNLENTDYQCMACPKGKISVPQADNTHTCVRCPRGQYGDAGSSGWGVGMTDLTVTLTCTDTTAGGGNIDAGVLNIYAHATASINFNSNAAAVATAVETALGASTGSATAVFSAGAVFCVAADSNTVITTTVTVRSSTSFANPTWSQIVQTAFSNGGSVGTVSSASYVRGPDPTIANRVAAPKSTCAGCTAGKYGEELNHYTRIKITCDQSAGAQANAGAMLLNGVSIAFNANAATVEAAVRNALDLSAADPPAAQDTDLFVTADTVTVAYNSGTMLCKADNAHVTETTITIKTAKVFYPPALVYSNTNINNVDAVEAEYITYGTSHLAADVCTDCVKGTYSEVTGLTRDSGCKGCGAGAYSLVSATAGASQKSLTCASECGSTEWPAAGTTPAYGLTVTDGVWAQLNLKGSTASDWSHMLNHAPVDGVAFSHTTYDLGTFGASPAYARGQFSQCVTKAQCAEVGLLADPISKTCVATCPSGLKADPTATNGCVLAKCNMADATAAADTGYRVKVHAAGNTLTTGNRALATAIAAPTGCTFTAGTTAVVISETTAGVTDNNAGAAGASFRLTMSATHVTHIEFTAGGGYSAGNVITLTAAALDALTTASGCVAGTAASLTYTLVAADITVSSTPTFSCEACPAGESAQTDAPYFFHERDDEDAKEDVAAGGNDVDVDAVVSLTPSNRASSLGSCRKLKDDAASGNICGALASDTEACSTQWLCENSKNTAAFSAGAVNTGGNNLNSGVYGLYWYTPFMYRPTKCKPVYCSPGEYVSNHACVTCPTGKYRNDAYANKAAGRTKFKLVNIQNADEACVAADIDDALHAFSSVNEFSTAVTTAACYTSSSGCTKAGVATDGTVSREVCGATGHLACNTEAACLATVDQDTLQNAGYTWRKLTVAELRTCTQAEYDNARLKCDDTAGADTACAARPCNDGTATWATDHTAAGNPQSNMWVRHRMQFESYVGAGATNALDSKNAFTTHSIACKTCPTGKVRAAGTTAPTAPQTDGAHEDPFTVCTNHECAWNEYRTGACYKKKDNAASGNVCTAAGNAACNTEAKCTGAVVGSAGAPACYKKDDANYFTTASGDRCRDDQTGEMTNNCDTEALCLTNPLNEWGSKHYWGGTCSKCPAGKAAYRHDDAFDERIGADASSLCLPMVCDANQRVATGVYASTNQGTIVQAANNYQVYSDFAGSTAGAGTPDTAVTIPTGVQTYFKGSNCGLDIVFATDLGDGTGTNNPELDIVAGPTPATIGLTYAGDGHDVDSNPRDFTKIFSVGDYVTIEGANAAGILAVGTRPQSCTLKTVAEKLLTCADGETLFARANQQSGKIVIRRGVPNTAQGANTFSKLFATQLSGFARITSNPTDAVLTGAASTVVWGTAVKTTANGMKPIGSGMTVALGVHAAGTGEIDYIRVVSAGSGYQVGDTIWVPKNGMANGAAASADLEFVLEAVPSVGDVATRRRSITAVELQATAGTNVDAATRSVKVASTGVIAGTAWADTLGNGAGADPELDILATAAAGGDTGGTIGMTYLNTAVSFITHGFKAGDVITIEGTNANGIAAVGGVGGQSCTLKSVGAKLLTCLDGQSLIAAADKQTGTIQIRSHAATDMCVALTAGARAGCATCPAGKSKAKDTCYVKATHAPAGNRCAAKGALAQHDGGGDACVTEAECGSNSLLFWGGADVSREPQTSVAVTLAAQAKVTIVGGTTNTVTFTGTNIDIDAEFNLLDGTCAPAAGTVTCVGAGFRVGDMVTVTMNDLVQPSTPAGITISRPIKITAITGRVLTFGGEVLTARAEDAAGSITITKVDARTCDWDDCAVNQYTNAAQTCTACPAGKSRVPIVTTPTDSDWESGTTITRTLPAASDTTTFTLHPNADCTGTDLGEMAANTATSDPDDEVDIRAAETLKVDSVTLREVQANGQKFVTGAFAVDTTGNAAEVVTDATSTVSFQSTLAVGDFINIAGAAGGYPQATVFRVVRIYGDDLPGTTTAGASKMEVYPAPTGTLNAAAVTRPGAITAVDIKTTGTLSTKAKSLKVALAKLKKGANNANANLCIKLRIPKDGTDTSAECRAIGCAMNFYPLTAAERTAASTADTSHTTNTGAGVCGACSAGSASFAVADVSVLAAQATNAADRTTAQLGNQHCISWTCPADHHVVNNNCVACVPGKYRAAGDATSGADTACAAINCAADTQGRHKVANGVCVKCSSGTACENCGTGLGGSAALTGTVATTSGKPVVVGSGTLFTRQLRVNDILRVPTATGGDGTNGGASAVATDFIVQKIVDDTHVEVDRAPTNSVTGQTPTVQGQSRYAWTTGSAGSQVLTTDGLTAQGTIYGQEANGDMECPALQCKSNRALTTATPAGSMRDDGAGGGTVFTGKGGGEYIEWACFKDADFNGIADDAVVRTTEQICATGSYARKQYDTSSEGYPTDAQAVAPADGIADQYTSACSQANCEFTPGMVWGRCAQCDAGKWLFGQSPGDTGAGWDATHGQQLTHFAEAQQGGLEWAQCTATTETGTAAGATDMVRHGVYELSTIIAKGAGCAYVAGTTTVLTSGTTPAVVDNAAGTAATTATGTGCMFSLTLSTGGVTHVNLISGCEDLARTKAITLDDTAVNALKSAADGSTSIASGCNAGSDITITISTMMVSKFLYSTKPNTYVLPHMVYGPQPLSALTTGSAVAFALTKPADCVFVAGVTRWMTSGTDAKGTGVTASAGVTEVAANAVESAEFRLTISTTGITHVEFRSGKGYTVADTIVLDHTNGLNDDPLISACSASATVTIAADMLATTRGNNIAKPTGCTFTASINTNLWTDAVLTSGVTPGVTDNSGTKTKAISLKLGLTTTHVNQIIFTDGAGYMPGDVITLNAEGLNGLTGATGCTAGLTYTLTNADFTDSHCGANKDAPCRLRSNCVSTVYEADLDGIRTSGYWQNGFTVKASAANEAETTVTPLDGNNDGTANAALSVTAAQVVMAIAPTTRFEATATPVTGGTMTWSGTTGTAVDFRRVFAIGEKITGTNLGNDDKVMTITNVQQNIISFSTEAGVTVATATKNGGEGIVYSVFHGHTGAPVAQCKAKECDGTMAGAAENQVSKTARETYGVGGELMVDSTLANQVPAYGVTNNMCTACAAGKKGVNTWTTAEDQACTAAHKTCAAEEVWAEKCYKVSDNTELTGSVCGPDKNAACTAQANCVTTGEKHLDIALSTNNLKFRTDAYTLATPIAKPAGCTFAAGTTGTITVGPAAGTNANAWDDTNAETEAAAFTLTISTTQVTGITFTAGAGYANGNNLFVSGTHLNTLTGISGCAASLTIPVTHIMLMIFRKGQRALATPVAAQAGCTFTAGTSAWVTAGTTTGVTTQTGVGVNGPAVFRITTTAGAQGTASTKPEITHIEFAAGNGYANADVLRLTEAAMNALSIASGCTTANTDISITTAMITKGTKVKSDNGAKTFTFTDGASTALDLTTSFAVGDVINIYGTDTNGVAAIGTQPTDMLISALTATVITVTQVGGGAATLVAKDVNGEGNIRISSRHNAYFGKCTHCGEAVSIYQTPTDASNLFVSGSIDIGDIAQPAGCYFTAGTSTAALTSGTTAGVTDDSTSQTARVSFKITVAANGGNGITHLTYEAGKNYAIGDTITVTAAALNSLNVVTGTCRAGFSYTLVAADLRNPITAAKISYHTNIGCQGTMIADGGQNFFDANAGAKLTINDAGSVTAVAFPQPWTGTFNAAVKCIRINGLVTDSGQAASHDLLLWPNRRAQRLNSAAQIGVANSKGTVYDSTNTGQSTSGTCFTHCLENEYVDTHVCTPCATGKYRGVTDQVMLRDTACTEAKCKDNEIIMGNRCLACPAGKTRSTLPTTGTGVAVPTGVTSSTGTNPNPNPMCTPTLCLKDQKVVNNACVACPAGKSTSYTGTNGQAVAGLPGDASLGDTTCHAVACPADHYVSSRLCDDVLGDFKNARMPLADQATGTACNRCTACDAWMTRPAGDLLTGTACNAAGTTAEQAACCTVARTCESKNEYVDSDYNCQTCPKWELENTAFAARNVLASSFTDRGGAMCLPKRCPLNWRTVVTGTCKLNGVDITEEQRCGANMHLECDTRATCIAGTYTGGVKAVWTKTGAVCEQCPEGTYIAAHTTAQSLSSMTATTLCVAHHSNGRAWPDGHTAAHGARLALCAAGQAVLNHACVACPTGFTSLAGDDPNSEKDTFIAPHTKASGSSCYPNVAVVPHTNEAGHTPNDLCAVNEHVVNHVCTACAAGKTNTAGDDRHHHDTECTTTYCSTNEYVSSNVCTACPVHGATGGPTYNTAGDDASGPDTKCQAATGYDSTHQ